MPLQLLHGMMQEQGRRIEKERAGARNSTTPAAAAAAGQQSSRRRDEDNKASLSHTERAPWARAVARAGAAGAGDDRKNGRMT